MRGWCEDRGPQRTPTNAPRGAISRFERPRARPDDLDAPARSGRIYTLPREVEGLVRKCGECKSTIRPYRGRDAQCCGEPAVVRVRNVPEAAHACDGMAFALSDAQVPIT